MPPDPGHDRCPRCLFQRRICLCADIAPVANHTRVVILRHHLERWRSSNTGRLAHFALANSELIDHPPAVDAPPLVLPPGAQLVFPAGPPTRTAPVPPPGALVFLDATWSQARRMFRKLPALRGLPLLHLAIDEEPAPTARLRAAPMPGAVSTIEAIARALRLVEGEPPAAALEQLFALAVERTRATGRRLGDPSSR